MSNSFNAEDEHRFLSWQKGNRRGKLATGLIIIGFGTLFLLRGLGVVLPSWIFSWEMILAAIGLVIVIKHKLKTFTGYFLILLAGVFLLHDWYPNVVNLSILWPIFFILLGIGMIFKSRFKKDHHGRHRFTKHHRGGRFGREHHQRRADFFNDLADLEDVSQDDFIDAVSIFGGVRKNVVSKQFRGADIVTIFGGNELNLQHADFNETVVMDITNIFGGTSISVPANWQVKSDMVVLFGDVDDKRQPFVPAEGEPQKIILLRGTCLFGGIEINGFNPI
jgi:predicted membrane protein